MARHKCAHVQESEPLETIREYQRTAYQEQNSAFETEIEANETRIKARLVNLPSVTTWLKKSSLYR